MWPPGKKIFEEGIVKESLKGMTIDKNPALQSHSEEGSGVARINIEISNPLGLCQQMEGKAFRRIQI